MGKAGEVADNLSMTTCKKILGGLWFGAGSGLFLIVVLQTLFGKYGDEASTAWGWLLPAVLPTLSLILGVLVMDAQGKTVRVQVVDKFLFVLTVALSGFYLLLVALTILMQPFVTIGATALMNESKLWLGPLQGLVSGSMGAFFVRGNR